MIPLVEMTIEMVLIARNRKELLLTLRDLISSTRDQSGCFACFACQDMENNKALVMTICWESRLQMDQYRDSKLFHALLGAIRLLCQSYQIVFKEVLMLNRLNSP